MHKKVSATVTLGSRRRNPPGPRRDPPHRPPSGPSADWLHAVGWQRHLSKTRRSLVRKLTIAAGIAALVVTGACKKTGEGTYEVQKPTVGTTTDTIHTPSVETGTVKDTI